MTTMVTESAIVGNVALGNQADGTGGGGIFFSGGAAMVTNSLITGNAAFNGGGIESAATSLFVSQDTFDGNHAVGTNGGDPLPPRPRRKGGGTRTPGAPTRVSSHNPVIHNTA